ncbi:MAG: type II toxin-antitoxin system VapC family toxin [Pseudomonadota bacterium]|uniref:type II toxin-antitoxin system VapC family toxin n=1 Tax=unclassified Phenylobacterium TaxID=2640670 RepID=UPI0006F267A6|nr:MULTISPECIES: type II toxin-antitoxin system VapC family toxin [unclassified Phenylobacterium]KRB52209.1 twitching motility protein PilT [Phenylobacterium sp. Root700]MBT9473396.1 type II toxin-antitoxin system VapC family toxin [Phenylobacterium sp.]
MIVVDTSALMAILLAEPEGDRCIKVLEAQPNVLISAGTLAEALIVACRRNIGGEMSALIDGLGFEVAPVSSSTSVKVAEAYARWGRGVHSASLNFGDCFAYALARETNFPLLFVGRDFAQTDVEQV